MTTKLIPMKSFTGEVARLRPGVDVACESCEHEAASYVHKFEDGRDYAVCLNCLPVTIGAA